MSEFGFLRHGCRYLSLNGVICMKCGKIHDIPFTYKADTSGLTDETVILTGKSAGYEWIGELKLKDLDEPYRTALLEFDKIKNELHVRNNQAKDWEQSAIHTNELLEEAKKELSKTKNKLDVFNVLAERLDGQWFDATLKENEQTACWGCDLEYSLGSTHRKKITPCGHGDGCEVYLAHVAINGDVK